MPRLEVRPFIEDDLGAAGTVLAARHAAHRAAHPLLAPRFAEVEEATRAVAELWKTDGASGAVAVSGGRVVGYLLGSARTSPLWGPNASVEGAGHAVEDAETVRDLYAAAASRWVEEGRLAHYAVVPGHDPELIDAWFRLGFGQQHVYAIREAPTSQPGVPHGFSIRRSGPDDAAALAALDLALPEHQARSPVFSSGPVPTFEEALADQLKDRDDPEYATFVAERDGELVGTAVGCPVEKSRMHIGITRPDNAALLGFAAVLPSARGNGIGTALGQAVLSWMGGLGYRATVIDWRATNLLSSRTWPKLGFRPTFLRLHRLIGY